MGGTVALLPQIQDELAQFIPDHALEHALLAQVAAGLGKGISSFDLNTEINDVWMYEHAQIHQTLSQIKGLTGVAGIADGWSDARTFQQWMQLNYTDHLNFQRAFGV